MCRLTWALFQSSRRFSIRFRIDFPAITVVQSLPNKDSINKYKNKFEAIICKEVSKGRYIGPFSANKLQDLIGPFQTSPLSIILKPGKPGKFCLIQNFLFPHASNVHFQSPPINSHIDVDNFPTTWGKFEMVFQLIAMLPPGSEAYQMVPLHPLQWPAGVVHASKDQFYVDTCMAFGATLSVGAYGHVADAGAEIFCH
jgi:hypothetical protein